MRSEAEDRHFAATEQLRTELREAMAKATAMEALGAPGASATMPTPARPCAKRPRWQEIVESLQRRLSEAEARSQDLLRDIEILTAAMAEQKTDTSLQLDLATQRAECVEPEAETSKEALTKAQD